MRVRVRKTPVERDVDGVPLDRLTPGRVCDVSSSLGSWLLAEGYADLEMRSSVATTDESDYTATPKDRAYSTIAGAPRHLAADRRRQDR